MPRTGERAATTAWFASDCGPRWRIFMRAGDEFPPCPHCHQEVNYTELGE